MREVSAPIFCGTSWVRVMRNPHSVIVQRISSVESATSSSANARMRNPEDPSSGLLRKSRQTPD